MRTYSLLSKRFFAMSGAIHPRWKNIRSTNAFCDLTGLRRPLRMSYLQIAERIKRDLDTH